VSASPLVSANLHHAAVAAELEALPALDLHALTVRWRKLLRSPVPDLPKYLLVRLLAYKLQAKAYGDLDRETARYLDRIALDRTRRQLAGEGKRKPKAPPPIPPVPDPRTRKAGTLLVREFEGVLHTVTVVPDGFTWQGRTYKSLSEIARLITGTRWNGPRFFGLRDKADPSVSRGGGAR
jgi:hypothetical protein